MSIPGHPRVNDLTGKVFGRLTVVAFDGTRPTKRGKKKAFWKCSCSCGNPELIVIKGLCLTRGDIRSCGCLLQESRQRNIAKGNSRKAKSEVGQTIRGIAVIEEIERYRIKNGRLRRRYLCRCHCGNLFKITRYALVYGKVKSCGCLPGHPHHKGRRRGGVRGISYGYFGRVKSSAKERGIEFDITIDLVADLFEKQGKRCALSGVELKPANGRNDFSGTLSVDRIDSEKGYVSENVQLVHKDINMLKARYSQETFLKMCQSVTSFQDGGKAVSW